MKLWEIRTATGAVFQVKADAYSAPNAVFGNERLETNSNNDIEHVLEPHCWLNPAHIEYVIDKGDVPE